MCFKTPRPSLCAEAWRILLHVTAGKELLPEHVRGYATRALDGLGAMCPEDDAAAVTTPMDGTSCSDGDAQMAPKQGPGPATSISVVCDAVGPEPGTHAEMRGVPSVRGRGCVNLSSDGGEDIAGVSEEDMKHAYSADVVENTAAVAVELARQVTPETQDALERFVEWFAVREALLPEIHRVTPGEACEDGNGDATKKCMR